MKHGERGFTLVELLIAVSIMFVLSGAAGAVTFQTLKGAARGNGYMSAVRQIENAGHWISRDAQMADGIKTDGLTWPDFLVINWVERDYVHDEIYHSATYYFDNFSGNIGRLMRRHWSSAGANETTLVGESIYYDAIHPDETKAHYRGPVLTVKLTSIIGEKHETKEYKIIPRPNM